ncbi:MAG: hypothetical protein CMM89_07620 [Rickettsiales bacterium]|nr:hypothetical protein [Rickettsiales bacterium]OUT43107.1 MAG: hypothetical protein CBB73_07400 [Pelagibacteraceae bacterium TMED13]
MYKYKILKISQVIDSENEFILKNSEKKLFDLATKKLKKYIQKNVINKKILFICGPGKNGLDGIKTEKLLKSKKSLIYLINKEKDLNLIKLSNQINNCDIIFDCIFGIGLKRKLDKTFLKIINMINSSKKKIISIDIPSGINSDTGGNFGANINADYTLAMGFFKPAHFLLPAKKYIGKLKVINLNLKLPRILKPDINIIKKKIIKNFQLLHQIDINKYDKGHVCVVGGKMAGAARIVAIASRKIGAGLSTISVEKKYLTYYTKSEVGTIVEVFNNSSLYKKNVFVIGPGLGKDFKKKKICKILENIKEPVILDADAISIFEKDRDKFYSILAKKKNVILTPHHGEFCRVFKYNKKMSKIDNCITASKLIKNIIIFKGNDTVVSFPDGKVYVDTESKKSLATAGSGDMLCGMIAGLISQGIRIEDAVLVSIFLQSRISREKNKTIVEDFIELIPKTLNLIKNSN